MDILIDIGVYAAMLRIATPLILGLAGCILCDRSGVVNVFIEGTMLTAAFCASFTAATFQNVWLGVGVAALAGALCGFIMALLTVGLKANQIVVGLGLNFVALGITSMLFSLLCFDASGNQLTSPPFERWKIPFLGDIPLVGTLLFNQRPLLYVALLVLGIVYGILYFTHPGLILRAVGEKAAVAYSQGVRVDLVRWIGVIIGSAIMGIGGSYIGLAEVTSFKPNLTAGRGFMGLAAMIAGKWHPLLGMAAALVFGFSGALQWKLQAMHLPIPEKLPNMLPYIATILVLAGLIGRAIPPGDLGNPFRREE